MAERATSIKITGLSSASKTLFLKMKLPRGIIVRRKTASGAARSTQLTDFEKRVRRGSRCKGICHVPKEPDLGVTHTTPDIKPAYDISSGEGVFTTENVVYSFIEELSHNGDGNQSMTDYPTFHEFPYIFSPGEPDTSPMTSQCPAGAQPNGANEKAYNAITANAAALTANAVALATLAGGPAAGQRAAHAATAVMDNGRGGIGGIRERCLSCS